VKFASKGILPVLSRVFPGAGAKTGPAANTVEMIK